MYNSFDEEMEDWYFTMQIHKGIKVARENNMKLSKFKDIISDIITTVNNEDQWTFDYESYLFHISNGIYESPEEWAKEYYRNRLK